MLFLFTEQLWALARIFSLKFQGKKTTVLGVNKITSLIDKSSLEGKTLKEQHQQWHTYLFHLCDSGSRRQNPLFYNIMNSLAMVIETHTCRDGRGNGLISCPVTMVLLSCNVNANWKIASCLFGPSETMQGKERNKNISKWFFMLRGWGGE